LTRQICLLIGETLRSFLFTIFFSNEFSRRGCSSAYLYEKSFGHPGMVDKPLCSIRQVNGTLIIKQQNFLTRPLQKVLRANELSDYLSSPRHGCLYESTLCLNKNYYIHNLINIPRATHVFYQTWNKFTLESALDIPHIFTLCTTA